MFKKLLQSLSLPHGRKILPPAAPVKTGTVAAAAKMVRPAAPVPSGKARHPEDLCQITSRMTKEQIQARLKLLYRRYNRAASSLDPATRAEAERMLEAVVLVREKHFGEI